MEFLLGLATGWLFTWPAILGFCAFGIWCEHKDSRGWAVFAALVALVSSYFYFDLTLKTVLIGIAAYIMVGVGWSIYRYSRFVTQRVAELKSRGPSIRPDELQYAKERLHPLRMVDTLVAWIIIWPFSFIEHLISDLLDMLDKLVTKVFRGVYVRIFENATKDLFIQD